MDLSRRTRRKLREHQLREALRLEREYYDLRNAEDASRREVELPVPIRAGWERYFFVRHDFRSSEDGPYLERVLRLVQNLEVSNRLDFAIRDWEHGGKMVPQEHVLRTVDAETYWAMTERMRSHFLLSVRRRKDWRGRTVLEAEFEVAHPWKFVSRVRAHYRTHEVVFDCNFASERAWIDHKLYGPWMKFRHLVRWHGRRLENYSRKPDRREPSRDAAFDDRGGDGRIERLTTRRMPQ